MNHIELFRVENLPVFQNKMFEDKASALDCVKGDVILVQNMDTGLIFNSAFDSSLLQYNKDYQNEQAHSSIFRDHLRNVKEIIERHFGQRSIIEVGCGKGYFLEYLLSAGYQIIGIDPAYEGENERIIKACFAPELGLTAEGIVLRHVLEHIQDPYDFLTQIAEANGNQGVIYIEVPCFDWICEHKAWFDIFYEHVNYFRLDDFHRMFDTVLESGNIFGGQYLYVVADISTLKKPALDKQGSFNFPDDFLSGFEQISNLAKDQTNVVWGGSSKGVIFSLYMQRAGINIDYIVDINPAKQGKYIGATGLRISNPEELMNKLQQDQNIFVMNSNYLEEIATLTKNKFNYIKVD